MIVVSNTTPILSLYKIGQLNLFRVLFGHVIIPMAVYNEITVPGKDKHGYNILDSIDYIYIKKI